MQISGKKINTTQVVSLVATGLVLVGIDLSAEDQVKIIAGIQVLGNIVTIIWRTWFTNTKPTETKSEETT